MISCGLQTAIGLWLMVSSAVLGYGEPAAASERTAGPIAGALAFVAVWKATRAVRWGVLAPAAWLVISPLVLGELGHAATVNAVTCGLGLMVLTPSGRADPTDIGGGWRALLRREPTTSRARETT